MLSYRAVGVPTGTPGVAAFTAAFHDVYVVAFGSGAVAFALSSLRGRAGHV
jgi:hypothetical protein